MTFSDWHDGALKFGQKQDILQGRKFKFTTFRNDLHIWSGTYDSFKHSLGFETELLIDMKTSVVFSVKSVWDQFWEK